MTDDELAALPPKPTRIDGANYEWTGWFGDKRCLLVGHKELFYDRELKTSVLDTRAWLERSFSSIALSRSAKFHAAAPPPGNGTLIYVYEDIGTDLSSTGEHRAKRGRKRFTGWFEVLEAGFCDRRAWLVAHLKARDSRS